AAVEAAVDGVARADDDETLARVRPRSHAAARAATDAERSFLASLEGGCQIPIGALGTVDGDRLILHGMVASLDGRTIVRGERTGAAFEGADIGSTLARELIARGAGDVLRLSRDADGDVPPPPAP